MEEGVSAISNIIIPDDCIGCRDIQFGCKLHQYSVRCPCSICLVKGICDQVCDDFTRFKWGS